MTAVLAGIVVDHYRNAPTPQETDPILERALIFPDVSAFMPNVPRSVALRAVFTWTQIFGFVSFELFGHLVGTVRHGDVTFDLLIEQTGDLIGLVT